MNEGYNPMTEGVRWSEKYDTTFERIWSRIPRIVSTTLGTIAVFLLGTSLQGTDGENIAISKMKRGRLYEFHSLCWFYRKVSLVDFVGFCVNYFFFSRNNKD